MQRNKQNERVNIGGDPDDPHYRYTRPRAAVRHVGVHAKGATTAVANLEQIATDLRRNSSILSKYIAIDLGTKVKNRKKNNNGSRQVSKKNGAKNKKSEATSTVFFGGRFEEKEIEERILQFTKLLVICGRCGDPGTYLTVGGSKLKRAKLLLRCGACGYLSSPQKTHKSLKAISKLVWDAKEKKPGDDVQRKPTVARPSVLEKADEQKKQQTADTECFQTDQGEQSWDDEWFSDTSADARKKRFLEEFSAAGTNSGGLFEIQ
mmetsp:Transcript_7781/g.9421  ORF Transcript_7781/g.9421 Transcript_7781/m.9421 type:complete len:263 (+) Transcript_7781:75-863(+)|eukprot:jgi/Bigna1/85066/estExt_fgenesh1_pg.C_20078